MLSESRFRLVTNTMVNEQGLLEDAEVESEAHVDDQSQINLFTPQEKRHSGKSSEEDTSSNENNLGSFSEYPRLTIPRRDPPSFQDRKENHSTLGSGRTR